MLTKNEIKYLKSLHQKKEREEARYFLCEGDKLVSEALNSGFSIKEVYISHKKLENSNNTGNFKAISEKEMEQISGFKTPPGIIALVAFPERAKPENNELKDQLFLVLDGINDPGNMGTILRNADWFGVKNVFCSLNSVDIFNSKVIQSSMGSVFRVNVFYTDLEALVHDLNQASIHLFAAVMDGKSASNGFMKKGGLIMGSESHGISEGILTQEVKKITIPKFGKAESLNVGVATGILLAMAQID